jgi:hypothetical protein
MMCRQKYMLVWLLVATLGDSCKPQKEPAFSEPVMPDQQMPDSAAVPVYWTSDPDTGRYITMHPAEPVPEDSLQAEHMIRYMNQIYPEMGLQEAGIRNDTLFLQLLNGSYLTQQLGSHGARIYLAELIYNCTEVPGIHFVTIQFEAGDHAAPGTYSRAHFRRP